MSSNPQPVPEARAPAVLYIGYHRGLLAERTAALRAAGYQVDSTAELGQAVSRLQDRAYDAIIVGHLVPEADRDLLVRQLRRQEAKSRIVLLYRDSIRHAECADALAWIGNGPVALVQTLDCLLGRAPA